jgi:hypothetical protein
MSCLPPWVAAMVAPFAPLFPRLVWAPQRRPRQSGRPRLKGAPADPGRRRALVRPGRA